MITSVAEHAYCTVDPEHTVMLIGVRVNAARVVYALCVHAIIYNDSIIAILFHLVCVLLIITISIWYIM